MLHPKIDGRHIWSFCYFITKIIIINLKTTSYGPLKTAIIINRKRKIKTWRPSAHLIHLNYWTINKITAIKVIIYQFSYQFATPRKKHEVNKKKIKQLINLLPISNGVTSLLVEPYVVLFRNVSGTRQFIPN